MLQTIDYETIEIHLGDTLRRADNLDIHADHFFPVTILDTLFHYSEKATGLEMEGNGRAVHRNFHGHDFDRWIDNIVAKTTLRLADDDGEITEVQLLDIDSFTLGNPAGEVTVTLPDETVYTLVDDEGSPLKADSINRLAIKLDIADMFSHGPVDSDSDPYMGFGRLAHLVRVVCEKGKIDVATVDQQDLSRRIVAHFKNELLPLIPSLWNDMEHIYHYGCPILV